MTYLASGAKAVSSSDISLRQPATNTAATAATCNTGINNLRRVS